MREEIRCQTGTAALRAVQKVLEGGNPTACGKPYGAACEGEIVEDRKRQRGAIKARRGM